MSVVDLVVVGAIVAAAVFFLVRGFVRGRPPPCHPVTTAAPTEPVVLVGPALARGLERARARTST